MAVRGKLQEYIEMSGSILSKNLGFARSVPFLSIEIALSRRSEPTFTARSC